MTDLVMPHSLEAEVSLLGAMILSRTAIDDAAGAGVQAADFYRTAHRHVFDAILNVARRGDRPDTVAVLDELIKADRLDEIGGASVIHDLTAAVPTASNASHYAKIVVETARRRRIIDAAQATVKAAADRTVGLDETIRNAVSRIVDDGTGSDGIVHVDDVYDLIAARIAGDTPVRGFSTGWEHVDKFFTIVPGNLTVVTGVPSSGKSEIVQAIALNAARIHGWKTGVFSPEQAPPDAYFFQRLWSRLAHDPRTADPGRSADELGWLHDHLVFIDDMVDSSLDSVLARATVLHRREGIKMLVIDPWNKLRHRWSGQKVRSDLYIQEALADVVRFAKTTGVHVWLVAHPRQMDLEPGCQHRFQVPTAYHIAGGAEWFNQADGVLSIWRDHRAEEDPAEKTTIHVQKVRGSGDWGRVGAVPLWFRPTQKIFGRYEYGSVPQELPA